MGCIKVAHTYLEVMLTSGRLTDLDELHHLYQVEDWPVGLVETDLSLPGHALQVSNVSCES